MDRINKLKEFLAANPGDSFLKHALALEYIKAGDTGMARSVFEELLEREPGYVGSYYHLAKLLESIGKNEEAIQCYEKGMSAAKIAGDQHTYNELRAAFENLG
jgi:Tfp pilus assembly protein PilF